MKSTATPLTSEHLMRDGETASDSQLLKAHIAALFSADANDFLWRADLTSNAEFQHRSWLGKIYVDYLMASECALKAAIIRFSPDTETPQAAYTAARCCGHKIRDLLIEAERRMAPHVSFVSAECSSFLSSLPYPVHARYDLELLHDHWTTKKGYDSRLNDTIRDRDFMTQIRRQTFAVVEVEREASKVALNRSLPIIASRLKTIQDAFEKLKL
jgi:hypothetical protein